MKRVKRLPPTIAENDLLVAVNAYITAHGGSAVLLGVLKDIRALLEELVRRTPDRS